MKELQEAFFGIRILRVRILVLVRPCHDEIPEIPVISEIPEILEIPGIIRSIYVALYTLTAALIII